MARAILLTVMGCAMLAVAESASATSAFLEPSDFSSFGLVTPAGPRLDSDFHVVGKGFKGTIVSQAWLLPNGQYLYLYQVRNDSQEDSLEQFVLNPFRDPAMNSAGYLTGAAPDGFLSGGFIPDVTAVPPGWTGPSDPYVSFDPVYSRIAYHFSADFGHTVPPGQHTVALYLISPDRSGLILGEVLDGGTATVPVVGPILQPATIPEPATMIGGLLCIASVGAYVLRGVRSQRARATA